LTAATIHVIDGIRASSLEMTDTIGNGKFWWNGYDDMNMIINISRSMDLQTEFFRLLYMTP
jgi:hypothetical protein